MTTAEELRDEGNAACKNGDLLTARDRYTEALRLAIEGEPGLKAAIFRNRSIVHFRLDDFASSESDATAALEIDRRDAKALYRRALARDGLENATGAFTDANEALRLLPNDKAIIDLLQRLIKQNAVRQNEANTMESRFRDMQKLAFQSDNDQENKEKAMNNLMVMARESETGAVKVWQKGDIVKSLIAIIEDKKNNDDEIAIAAVRVIDELVKKNERAMRLIEMLDLPFITRLMCKRNAEQYLDASGVVIQRIFNALAKMDRVKEVKPDVEVAEANKVYIIRLILELEEMLTDPKMSSAVRETVLDLLLKNLMHMDGGLPRGWSWRFVEDRGLLKLLHVAMQIPEQCDYPVSAETRQHNAICLARLYDDMVFDTKRTIFTDRLNGFFKDLVARIDDPRVKIQLSSMLITLLQGAVDVGINLVTNDRITAMMLEMAASTDHLQQTVAAELIVQTVSKHERATTILKFGVPILRKLYDSPDEAVKVRALVGLCKCASAGGDDCSRQTMQEGSTIKLASACKKFLLDVNKYSIDVRRFACEGLSYLSLDADVKEWIVADPLLMRALVLLGKSAGALCVYTLAAIYVNLTNSYEKPKVEEELVKLAQFAKHHVPETHPKDTEEFVEKRVKALIEDGAVSACVAVSKTESKNAMELLARAMLAFSEIVEQRGRIISEGGAKLLLQLSKDATPEGKIKAAHALAKLGSQADPSIVFPGQRCYEVVKPMIELLHPDIDGIPNYDALLTLTNLASLSDSVRSRILKEKGSVAKIEEFWYMTDHVHLRAAAAELLLNLLFNESFLKQTVRPGTDRLKLWVLYCAEEDERLALATSAGFVIVSQEVEANRRILDEIKSWPSVLTEICMAEHAEVQRRCLMAIANMIESDEKVAAQIIASEVFAVLVAITKLQGDQSREGSQKEARRALAAAQKYSLIVPTDRELYERNNNLSTVVEE